MRIGFVIGLSLALCSCSSSGVMQIGPDSYRISTEAMSVGGAESDAISAAGRHCASLGRQLNVTGMMNRPYISYASYASATVNFQCVPVKAGS